MRRPITGSRPEEVAARLGVSRRQVDRWVKAGKFPKPIRIGDRAVIFIDAEVDAELERRAAERAAKQAEQADAP
jgi:excisionase family DNA binding protein